MNKAIDRTHDLKTIKKLLNTFPVTAILGPRQSGKTFLAKQKPHQHYFDLENPKDLARLANPQLTLEPLNGLILIDEIQRKPEIFPLLRHLCDHVKKQSYLILGSASGKPMKQSSESLAGRIGYYSLGGFTISDIGNNNLKKLWIRGGLPRSFLALSEEKCFLWLQNYIATFLERDIPQLGITIPSQTLRRFWTMLSHYHGQVLNYSELARSFGISDMTVRKYLNILSSTFMVRILQPWHENIGKRLVKSPKIYIRDSGIFHSLLSIDHSSQLWTHNKLGASWEGFALECVFRSLGKRNEEVYFWRTHAKAEVDLFWKNKGKNFGIEFKYSDAPKATKSMHIAMDDLKLSHLWIIYPGSNSYKLDKNISVLSLRDIEGGWKY